jgi:hypothetical protein
MAEAVIAIERLRQLLRHDPESGQLFWLPREGEKQFNGRFAGREALTAICNSGYRIGLISYQNFKAHRVIWALHYGEWPTGHIDHINGNPSDNRIANLRVVTTQENGRNSKRSVRNKSGITGVYQFAGKWRAVIFNQRSIHLGTFATLEEAAAARKAAEVSFGYHPNHGREAA